MNEDLPWKLTEGFKRQIYAFGLKGLYRDFYTDIKGMRVYTLNSRNSGYLALVSRD